MDDLSALVDLLHLDRPLGLDPLESLDYFRGQLAQTNIYEEAGMYFFKHETNTYTLNKHVAFDVYSK